MRCCLKYELSGGRSIHESSGVADFPHSVLFKQPYCAIEMGKYQECV